jgi:hypothetical protein
METSNLPPPVPVPKPVSLRSGLLSTVMMIAGILGLGSLLWGRRIAGLSKIRYFDPLYRGLRQAARSNDLGALRHWAAALVRRDGGGERGALVAELDAALFRPDPPLLDARAFEKRFLKTGTNPAP